MAEQLIPGQKIAVDQYEIVKKGRAWSGFGRVNDNDKLVGGTMFVDMATGYQMSYHQSSLDASTTIKAKVDFERKARDAGVVVQSFMTDNGIFTSHAFNSHLHSTNQRVSFCGINAHHQNGIAEVAIKTHITKSRALLLHAMLRWPDTTKPEHWPMAMSHASFLVNNIPRMDTGFTAAGLFTKHAKN